MISGSSHYTHHRLASLLVDGVPSMLAYWDTDMRCRYANKAYVRWFGTDPHHLLGKSIQDLLGPELFALNEPYIRGALLGKEQTFERIVPGPDGTKRFAIAYYVPDVVDGTVLGFMVQVTQIIQPRDAGQTVPRAHVLKVEMEERARALAESTRERTEMMGLLAHEVRQPLNNANAALQAAAAALSAAGLQAPVELNRARAVINQVASSIDNTLAVMNLLGRAQPIVQVESDLDLLIAMAVADLPEATRERVKVERWTTVRTVQMDPTLMRLALRNLLSNAVKFSDAGAEVTVRLLDSDDPLALVIEVRDPGPGLDDQSRSRLFQRGGRGTHPASGHGLGLYIVRRVMELHGGTVDVADEASTGTCLRLTLPQGRL